MEYKNSKQNSHAEPILSPFQSKLENRTGMGFQNQLLKYAKWAGTPPQFRKTQSEKEFCEQTGINELALANLKRHPKLNILVVEATSKWMIEKLPTFVGDLAERAHDTGDPQDVHIFVMVVRLLEDIKKEKLL